MPDVGIVNTKVARRARRANIPPQLSRLEAVVVASPKPPASPDITLMASQPQMPSVCLHKWRVPHFALKFPCNPPPRHVRRLSLGDGPPPLRRRPSRAGGIFQGGEGSLCVHFHPTCVLEVQIHAIKLSGSSNTASAREGGCMFQIPHFRLYMVIASPSTFACSTSHHHRLRRSGASSTLLVVFAFGHGPSGLRFAFSTSNVPLV